MSLGPDELCDYGAGDFECQERATGGGGNSLQWCNKHRPCACGGYLMPDGGRFDEMSDGPDSGWLQARHSRGRCVAWCDEHGRPLGRGRVLAELTARVYLLADFGKGPEEVERTGAIQGAGETFVLKDEDRYRMKADARAWWLVSAESADAARRTIEAWSAMAHDPVWPSGRILASGGAKS